MKTLKSGAAYYGEFTTQRFDTGAVTDADAPGPVVTATRNGTDDAGFVLTATKIDTGRYKITGTVAAYTAGDVIQISVAATVGGVAGKAVVDEFQVVPASIYDSMVSGSQRLSAATTPSLYMAGDATIGGNACGGWYYYTGSNAFGEPYYTHASSPVVLRLANGFPPDGDLSSGTLIVCDEMSVDTLNPSTKWYTVGNGYVAACVPTGEEGTYGGTTLRMAWPLSIGSVAWNDLGQSLASASASAAILEDTGTTLPATIPSASTIATAVVGQACGTTAGSLGKAASDAAADAATCKSQTTAANIGAAVWNYLVASATTVGSMGKYILDTLAAIVATTGAAAGTAKTINVKDTAGNPLAACSVWITSDVDGSTVTRGSKLTNADGDVTFTLAAGVHYVWRQKEGYTFTNPQAITVS